MQIAALFSVMAKKEALLECGNTRGINAPQLWHVVGQIQERWSKQSHLLSPVAGLCRLLIKDGGNFYVALP